MIHDKDNKQVKVDIDIFYPSVNNLKVWEGFNDEGPIMKVIAIREEALILISKVPLNLSDFITFLISIGNSTSFNCLLGVEKVKEKRGQYVAFCKFYLLKDNQIKAIKQFLLEN